MNNLSESGSGAARRSDRHHAEWWTTLFSAVAVLSFLFLIVAGARAGTAAVDKNGAELRGSGDLALVVERASGSVQIVETTANRSLRRIEGLGDLSHASAVFSRDQRYAFVFGRDGGLSKVDLLLGTVVARTLQSGNSIGGAVALHIAADICVYTNHNLNIEELKIEGGS